MKLDAFAYFIVHLLTPVLLLGLGLLWGHWIVEKPLANNVTDNLSIVAIYYVLVSIIWFLKFKDMRGIGTNKVSTKSN